MEPREVCCSVSRLPQGRIDDPSPLDADPPILRSVTSEPAEPPVKRIVYLNRRVAFIEPGRVNVRPALAAALFPLFGLLLGIAAFVSIILWLDSLPFALALLLLMVAIVSIPLAGIGFVYTVAGANVVFEREKQSGVWQQGFLGMGVGTIELVPFWKIDQIRIEEITRERQRGEVQDLAQLEIVVVKVSGKRLSVGDIIVARSMVREGLAEVREVADAIAGMTGKPLIAPTVVRRPRTAAAHERAPQDDDLADDILRPSGDLNMRAGQL
jgi:hypothetical protein